MNLRNKISVLLVDDDDAMLKLVEQMLKKSLGDHLEIEATNDPRVAKKRLSETSFDIVLTDFAMPEIDGLQLLKHLRQKNPATQVLMLTGNTTREALLEAMELGASDYILKPVTRDELIKLVEEAMARRNRWLKALAGTLRAAAQS